LSDPRVGYELNGSRLSDSMYRCARWLAHVNGVALAVVVLAPVSFRAGASVATAQEKPMSLTITSTAFAPGGTMPSLYTFRPASGRAT